tara:strand:- start:3257 stop:3559 length:303 start_codon:yes stop_codon:yes gene_type:complete
VIAAQNLEKKNVTPDDLKPLEQAINDLTHKLDTHIRVTEVHQGHVIELVQSHEATLNGNGDPGLRVRVDRIETSANVISRISWTGLVVALAAIASFFVNK